MRPVRCQVRGGKKIRGSNPERQQYMLLRDLVKQYNISEDVLLSTLKALKLRAKGDTQELSPGVLALLKSDLQERGLIPVEKE
ncbi:MAG: hypothetical protein WCI27_00685, partial [Candidatus Omnitrophota bacterium]